MLKTFIPLLFATVFLMACQPEPVTVEVPVTIEMPVTVEVPVTVEITREATRIVEAEVTTEVTRLIEVTRLVQVTPRPEDTPAPTPTPEVLTTAENYLVGNIDLTQLPVAEEDGIAVIGSGPLDRRNDMPILVSNGTGQPIKDISGSAIVRSADGSLLGTGEIETLSPTYVLPNGWAYGVVEFSDPIPVDAGVEFKFDHELAASDVFFEDLEILEHSNLGNKVVGFMLNSSDSPLKSLAVRVLCFDEGLNPLTYDYTYADQEDVDVGEQAAFEIEPGDAYCPYYLVSARGY